MDDWAEFVGHSDRQACVIVAMGTAPSDLPAAEFKPGRDSVPELFIAPGSNDPARASPNKFPEHDETVRRVFPTGLQRVSLAGIWEQT